VDSIENSSSASFQQFSMQANDIVLNVAIENVLLPVWLGLQCSNNVACTWFDGTPLIGFSNFRRGKVPEKLKNGTIESFRNVVLIL
jgi:hypothetical protein